MKQIKNIHDSKSLWNYTLSPGWTEEEVEVLKIALMKFGIGKWRKILKSNCLPGKTIAQMNLQTQRLLGQQSLAEFMGIHIDLEKVFQENKKKIGPEIIRKNNFIINSGDNITQDQRNFRIKLNNEKYGLSKEFINSLKIPKLLSLSMGHHLNIKQIMDDKNNFSILEKIDQLKNLIECMKKKLQFIERVENKRKKEKILQKNHNDTNLNNAVYSILELKNSLKNEINYDIENNDFNKITREESSKSKLIIILRKTDEINSEYEVLDN